MGRRKFVDKVDVPTSNQIRTNLAQFRKAAGLSQADASQLTGLSLDEIRRWEQGVRVPDVIALKRLADVYGRKAGDFFQDNPPPADPADLPPFLVVLHPGVHVDDDLLAELDEAVQAIRDKHAARVRARRAAP